MLKIKKLKIDYVPVIVYEIRNKHVCCHMHFNNLVIPENFIPNTSVKVC